MIRLIIHRVALRVVNATRAKRVAFQPSKIELDGGIEHIVYEYSNFVYAHEFMEARPGGGEDVIVVFNAFLLNIRQFADFFGGVRSKPDILALDYSHCGIAKLPHAKKWRGAIDKQLAHLSYDRVTKPQPVLSETQTRRDLFNELAGGVSRILADRSRSTTSGRVHELAKEAK